jgi:hypothetical protein
MIPLFPKLVVASLTLLLLAAPASAQDPGSAASQTSAPPTKEAWRGGGVAIELSAGGLAAGSLQGGLLLGVAVRDFVFGLTFDYLSSTGDLKSSTVTGSATSGAARVGVGARLPLLRPGDGRVALFLDGEAGLVSREAAVINSSGMPASSNASGTTWAAGPGLRLWVGNHLAVAYVTRLRGTYLSGAAAALPEAPTASPDQAASATNYQLEGTFQVLGVF